MDVGSAFDFSSFLFSLFINFILDENVLRVNLRRCCNSFACFQVRFKFDNSDNRDDRISITVLMKFQYAPFYERVT